MGSGAASKCRKDVPVGWLAPEKLQRREASVGGVQGNEHTHRATKFYHRGARARGYAASKASGADFWMVVMWLVA
eukprot:77978-Pelagomonas_calceolata.AAC.2